MTGTCPRCGEAISGVATHGPGDHRARPCGHRVGGAAVRRLAREDDDRSPPQAVADGGSYRQEDPQP